MIKICLVSSEVAPFAKSGGLADVTAAVARYLKRQGHEVMLLMPMYERVRSGGWRFDPHPSLQDMRLEFGERYYTYSISTARLPKSEVDVMFVRCPDLYGREEIYTSDSDEHIRFGLLSRAALEVCQWLQWSPDIVHCHDWHTGLIPLYLKAGYTWDKLFDKTRTLLTIHNIGYQGVFGSDVLNELGFEDHRQLFHQEDLQAGTINYLKTGILYADAITTVSETYAREIRSAELGMGLEGLLEARADRTFGIVNGVDYDEWNPETDHLIPHHFSVDDLRGKGENKRALLEGSGLPYDPDVPTFGIVSRLTAQKGFELLPDVLPVFLQRHDMRLVVLGSGEDRYESYFQWLMGAFPSKVSFTRGYDNELAHQIEAGADVFLMPSRYEPCGLNQMYSLKYGTIPIVRKTGGLADTVQDFDPETGQGTGFVFEDFSPDAFFEAFARALECYGDRVLWQRLIKNGMTRDYSWDRQGAHYVELYRRLMPTK